MSYIKAFFGMLLTTSLVSVFDEACSGLEVDGDSVYDRPRVLDALESSSIPDLLLQETIDIFFPAASANYEIDQIATTGVESTRYNTTETISVNWTRPGEMLSAAEGSDQVLGREAEDAFHAL